jgi:hypothetical protein
MNILTIKIITGCLAIIAIAIIAIDPTIKVAVIVSIPPTLTALFGAFANYKQYRELHKKVNTVENKVDTVEVNTNAKLTKLLDERNVASARADQAEGHIEGVKSEQDRTKS